MFSQSQIIFAIVFAVIFIGFMIWSYIKDFKMHKYYYKNVFIVAIGIFIVVTLFAVLTFWLHK